MGVITGASTMAAVTAWHDSSATVRVPVDTDLYTLEALFCACYKFTDRCYLLLERADERTVVVEFRRRQSAADLADVVGAFGNELIDQRVRADLARETRTVRDLIYTQAFIEADLGGGESDGGS